MGEYLDKILALTPETPEASSVHKPFGSPSGPGLWKHKGMQLPAYIQNVAHAMVKNGKSESEAIHMAVGIVKGWAAGHSSHGKVHPDVKAAAAKAIAEWEALKAKAHAESGAKDVKASAPAAQPQGFLVNGEPTNPGVLTSPGVKPLEYGTLHQEPSQTAAASPAVPAAAMPSPNEIQHLADTVGSDSHSSPLTQSAHIHLQQAAHAMSQGDHVDALHLLRSAQTDVADEHRNRETAVAQSSAAVFSGGFGGAVPPAEQSSAHTSMMGHLASAHRTRVLGEQIAHHIDSIRRAHFHGLYAGSPSSRI